jgi:hypothetical protein
VAPSATDFVISDLQLDRILDVMGAAWTQSTKESYGAGLLVFHVYCDEHKIPELKRCPIDPNLLLAFLSSCAGSYSGSALSNYTAALRAWHLLHGKEWSIQPPQLKAILDGAATLAPPASKRPKRSPFTPELICKIRDHLDLNTPLDAAVFACLTTSFYCIARLGEFTVPTIKGTFDPSKFIARKGVSEAADRNGILVTKFRLPRTKSSPAGEETYWAAQEGPSDPKAALANHLKINPATEDAHLFTWIHPSGNPRPLSKAEFLKRMSSAASAAGLPSFKGHSLRIGGTLEYLLRGVPFDVVKSMGRWSSESFALYLRQHAMIIAPYIQATPVLEPFTRYTMPPVR